MRQTVNCFCVWLVVSLDVQSVQHVACDDLDSIEANVETASVSVEQGVDQLRQARRSQVRLVTQKTSFLGISRKRNK